MTSTKLPVSVLIPAKNEELNLPACLESVARADQILLVDSQSEDRSVEIAQQYGAEVIQFYYSGTGDKKKNWSLKNLDPDNPHREIESGKFFRHEWVLIVDSDERITPELWTEIEQVIKNSQYNGYYLNRKVVFLGKWLRHGGKYPDWNLRLFKHKLGRYEDLGISNVGNTGDNEIHEHVVLQDGSKAGFLKHDMDHIDFRDLYQWLARHNRYLNWEAAFYDKLLKGELPEVEIAGPIWKKGPRRTRLLRKIWIRLPLRSLLRFILTYVFLLGFLDGKAGYMYARLLSQYEYQITVKLYELRKFGGKLNLKKTDQTNTKQNNLNGKSHPASLIN